MYQKCNGMFRPRGHQVLDYESICCLLVLLFIDDSRINTACLHRVFRNLCYHQQTREWLIRVRILILSVIDYSKYINNINLYGIFTLYNFLQSDCTLHCKNLSV